MGSKQFGFGDYEQSTAKKRTRREKFLAEMEVVVPWKLLIRDFLKRFAPRWPELVVNLAKTRLERGLQ
jgi:IS5 family transposase